jgi:hypothetical protein
MRPMRPSSWETWATLPRRQSALNYLKVDGLRVKYSEWDQEFACIGAFSCMHANRWPMHMRAAGPGEEDTQAATIIANCAAPSDCPLFYFEVEIINR